MLDIMLVNEQFVYYNANYIFRVLSIINFFNLMIIEHKSEIV